MSIESDGSLFCKFTMIENGRQTTRRVHEMVVQAIDGRTYRLSGRQLPDSVVLLTGASTGGKHFAEVLCDPRIPSPRIFAFLRWPKKRDALHMIVGAVFLLWSLLTIALFAQAFAK